MSKNKTDYNHESEVILVTPDMAKSWLSDRFESQRQVSQQKVSMYLREMRLGYWKLTHQPIAISSEGKVLDGQHRLEALIQYGQPLRMTVVLNADPDTFGVIDRGYTRTKIQVAKMAGCDFLSSASVSALHTLLWVPGVMSSAQKGWSFQDLPIVANHFEPQLNVVFAKGLSEFRVGYVRGAVLRALISQPHQEKKIARFLKVLTEGVVEHKSENAAVQLGQRLISSATVKGNSINHRFLAYGMTTHALKLFFSGQALKHKGNLGKQGSENWFTSFPTIFDDIKPYETFEQILKRKRSA